MLELRSQRIDSPSDDRRRQAHAWLVERQEWIRSQIRQITLLGELDPTPATLEESGEAIRTLVAAFGPSRALNRLDAKFPLATAELLVASGIYDYKAGNFWTPILERTGFPEQNYRGWLGEIFERAAEENGLASFAALAGEPALRFVAPLLFHGGIPNYCLDDFFTRVLIPTAAKGAHRDRTPGEVIATWRERGSTFVDVDKPVERFLIHGGKIAADFIGRCLDMADLGLSGALKADADLGLPRRIVDAFVETLKGDAIHMRSTAPRPRQRLVNPELLYDPWAAEVYLALPEQAAAGESVWFWRADAGGWSGARNVTPWNRHAGRTRSAEIEIPSPFPSLGLSLEADGDVLRHWRFPGFAAGRPWLAFDGETGAALDGGQLQAGVIRLIVPRSAHLTVERDGERAEASVLEEFQALSGDWAGYRGLELNLGGCSALIVTQEKTPHRVSVARGNEGEARAALIGGERCQLPIAGWRDAFYQGAPPVLHLPLPERAGQRFSPAGWTIQARGLGNAASFLDARFRGDDPMLAEAAGDGIRIDLSNRELLGPEPMGSFEIIARGPLGFDARFEFTCLPRFEVAGIERVVMPGHQSSMRFRLRMAWTARIEVSSGAEPALAVTERALGDYELALSESFSALPLVFTAPKIRGVRPEARIAVPLRLASWHLRATEASAGNHADGPAVVSRDEIERDGAAALVVAVPDAGDGAEVRARIVDGRGRGIYAFAPRPVARPARFPLREALDAIRLSSDAHLRLEVEVAIPNGELASAEAVIIAKSLRVSDLSVEDELTGLIRRLRLRWHEPERVTNRVVRLWSMWRLWEDRPVEIEIPDEAADAVDLARPRAQLHAGAYRVEIAVRDPWIASGHAERPAIVGGNCVDVQLGDADELDEHLGELSNDEPRGILERFAATRDPRALELLAETLDPHEVEDVVRAAIGFIRAHDVGAVSDPESARLALDALRSILLERPETLPIVADLSGSDSERDNWLGRLLVELGVVRAPLPAAMTSELKPSQRRALWRLWPPLLGALDGEALLAGDDAIIEPATLILGERALSLSVSSALGLDAHPLARSVAFPGHELGLSTAQLKGLSDWAKGAPATVLDDHFWTQAMLDWLLRVREDDRLADRAKAWLRFGRSTARDDIEALRANGLGRVARIVAARVPTASNDWLAFIPFVVGTTALVERATALGMIGRSALLNEASLGFSAPREALLIAPELYARDLCLMDLLLRAERLAPA